MKLSETLKDYSKDSLFDTYCRIVDEFKDYDKITKPKMIEAIIKEYSNYQNIIDICTLKELKFLKKVINNENINYFKYSWENENLHDKCLLIDGEIPEEISESVNTAVSKYKPATVKELDRRNELLVGLCKVYGELLLYPLVELSSSILNLDNEEVFKHIRTNKLFKFYVYEDTEYVESLKSEIPIYIYQDYFDYVDELRDQRRKYGEASIRNFEVETFINFFYYDMNINNQEVKKLYNYLNENPFFKTLFLPDICLTALLYSPQEELFEFMTNLFHHFPDDLNELISLIKNALNEIPSGALNGLSPREYQELMEEKITYEKDKQQKNMPQTNACLSPKDAKLFYKLFFALLEYTNNTYHINPKIKKIYGQTGINPNSITTIREKLWQDKEQIINDFIAKNPYHFNNEELDIISKFKKAIVDLFTIARYEEEYTAILYDGKTYMIKGINSNIDTVIPSKNIPTIIETTILPFKEFLVYDSLLSTYPISFGINFAQITEEEYKKSIKYYHL